MGNLSTTTLVGLLVVVALIGGLLFALAANNEQQALLSITTFDECAAAGFPIMESYPEQCRTSDGRLFVNERQHIDVQETIVANGCAVAGCSGELCVSADEASDIMTTCVFRPEYACYREASCEPQANGACGWSETPELKRCLANPPGPANGIEAVY